MPLSRKLIIIPAVFVATALPTSTAQAHNLTCSQSKFSHWADLKKDSRLVADDKPRTECIQVKKNYIRVIGSKPGVRIVIKQNIIKVAEKTYGWPNSPFYYFVRYYISRPFFTYYG